MLTPAFSLTATERVLPRLALDFTTGVLDSRVTVTRALNTATRVNSSGYIEGVNANLPRFDYDSVTRAPKGLLIEETRSNLLLQSQDISTSWTNTNSSETTDAVISPDGTQNADKLLEDATLGVHYIEQLVTTTAAPHTFSARAKPAERNWVRLFMGGAGNAYFDVLNGVVGTVSAGMTASISGPDREGFYHCKLTGTPTAASNAMRVYTANADNSVSYSGNPTFGLYVWGIQLEAGTFATSYIPTTTTSLTRNADQVTMTGSNFSDWYNASEGAFVVEASTPPSGTYAPMIQVDSGTTNNRIVIGQTAGGFADYSVVSSGSAQASFQTTTITNSTASIAGVYKTDSFARAVNGEAVSTDNLGLVPTVNNLKIGSNLTPVYLNRHMRKIRFYSQRILNAEATAFSKL